MKTNRPSPSVLRLAIGCSLALALLVGAFPARAGTGTMTCGAPSSGGTISLRLKVGKNTICQDPLTITIPAPPTPPVGGEDTSKAEVIRKTIESKCKELTVTRAKGSNVVEVSAPDGKVTIEELGNTTGETDSYAMVLPDGWPGTRGQLCTLAGTAAGLSFGPIGAGHVSVGTATYVASVPTSAGESPSDVLGAALIQLQAHGVTGVSLVSLGTNQAGLLFHLTAADPVLTWGCDDRNLWSQFLVLEDSTEFGAGSQTGEFFVPPGTPGVTIQLDAAANQTHTEATLFGYDPGVRAWIEQGYWSLGSAMAQLQIGTSPQIVHYQLRCEGDHAPITGTIVENGVPMPPTPSTPRYTPAGTLGWADGSDAEFNPTLGQGGGIPVPITLQPGLSLGTVPAHVGSGFWNYIPLQLDVQPDPTRPWLYVGNDPGQSFAEHTLLKLDLSGLFDPFGNPVPQLPITVGYMQGAVQWSTTVNASLDPNGGVTVPSIDLGSLRVQPLTLFVGVGAGPGPQSAASLSSGTAGFVAVGSVELTSATTATSGVGDSPVRAEGVQLSAPYPNPCRSGARLHFAIPDGGPVTLQILDAAGRTVRTVVDGSLAAGAHDLRWDGRDDSQRRVAEGIYFARLIADRATRSRKIAMLR